MTFCIRCPYVFFAGKITNSPTRGQKCYNSETAKGRNLKWSRHKSFFVQILGAIGHVIWVFDPKTELLIVGLNSSSSKTNCTIGIKVSNLEASGQAVSALKNKL